MSNELTLAITTIGDLLQKNKITNCGNGKALENIKLTIPNYQRPYKWTAKNANQLLQDIQEAMSANREIYRVGTLILHHDNEQYAIVDGQQRCITFALLLHCIFSTECKMQFMSQEVARNSISVQNVSQNYHAMKRQIDRMDCGALKDFITNRCEFIVVITDDLSEAFQFFDSQNARGKALYPHDLLKAYHLREMNQLSVAETERVVQSWEEMDQKALSVLFRDYLYRLKEWIQGNRAGELTEHNIELFKGVRASDSFPYAQYYKGAFAYADQFNHSLTPFVTGNQPLRPFQLDAPIIAGKPFFEYARYYFDILADIQNNDPYEGYFINGNEIVKTLNQKAYRNGTGNRITRLMFDTAIMLYVDRFCPSKPMPIDSELLERFVVYAFIWAYSMRAQYKSVGWLVAQNYILGTSKNEIVNAFNMYKVIIEADSPIALFSRLDEIMHPLKFVQASTDNLNSDDEVKQNYLYYFKENHFWEGKK